MVEDLALSAAEMADFGARHLSIPMLLASMLMMFRGNKGGPPPKKKTFPIALLLISQ